MIRVTITRQELLDVDACACGRVAPTWRGLLLAVNKVVRNTSTASSRAFWDGAKRASVEVQRWPDWKRAGINVSTTRTHKGQVGHDPKGTPKP